MAVIRVFACGALAAVLLSLGGCGLGADGPDCTLVATPAGPAPSACVIAVPNGASVTTAQNGATVVTLNGVVIASYPPCPCPRE